MDSLFAFVHSGTLQHPEANVKSNHLNAVQSLDEGKDFCIHHVRSIERNIQQLLSQSLITEQSPLEKNSV